MFPVAVAGATFRALATSERLFFVSMFPEFVKAEGFTEVQFRDACEKEMQGKDPAGMSFMHALISSWEFSR